MTSSKQCAVEAMRRAYLADLNIVTALFLWLMAASRAGWSMPVTSGQWGAIGFATVMTMLTLPIIFAEFMVPMPDPEDQPQRSARPFLNGFDDLVSWTGIRRSASIRLAAGHYAGQRHSHWC